MKRVDEGGGERSLKGSGCHGVDVSASTPCRFALSLLMWLCLALGAWSQTARVTAYDNWISFGQLSPQPGSWSTPESTIADGDANAIGPDSGSYDIAGLRVYTGMHRACVTVLLGGNLVRTDENGNPAAATDTRVSGSSPYALRTEYKVYLRGKFLTIDAPPYGAGNPYVSPTSGLETDYNMGAGWSAAPGGDGGASVEGDGWLSPSATHAWTGAIFQPTEAEVLTDFSILVERNQDGITYSQAEIWFAERVWQRGLQDVAGNYGQTIEVHVVYAEGD